MSSTLPIKRITSLADIGDLTIGKQIGKGGFGVVYQGTMNVNGVMTDVAIKEIRIMKSSMIKQLHNEIEYMYKLKQACSDYVVHVYDILYIDKHEYEVPKLYIIMELIVGDDLHNIIEKTPFTSDDTLYPIVDQLMKGLVCIHSAGFVHLDVKPLNVMYDTSKGVAKWIDFGLACMEEKCNGIKGTPMYIAPEIITREIKNWKAADVWSFGLMVYKLMTGVDNPYQVVAANYITKRSKKVPTFDMLEKSLTNLDSVAFPLCVAVIKRCLLIDPKRRWNAWTDEDVVQSLSKLSISTQKNI